MGYRLYVYEKGKENYDICLFKFFMYAEYKYIKPCWEYLWPRVVDQFPNHLYDKNECEHDYEFEHIGGSFTCNVTADIFRKFIDLYIMGRNEWIMDGDSIPWSAGDININDPEWIKLKELYNSDCDKVLDWG